MASSLTGTKRAEGHIDRDLFVQHASLQQLRASHQPPVRAGVSHADSGIENRGKCQA